MRHNVYGRKFSRTKNERRRLFQGLVKDLIKHGSIETSLAKAKAIQPMVDKLITKAKQGKTGQFRTAQRTLADKGIAKLFLSEIQTRYGNRTSGFTRIIRIGQQVGDAMERVHLQLVDERVVTDIISPTPKPKEDSKTKLQITGKKSKQKRISRKKKL